MIRNLAAAAAALALTSTLAPAQAAGRFTLSSPSFADGSVLPLKYAGDLKTNPNCVGRNVSPALAWSNPPAGVKSYAFMMVDLQGRSGMGVNHWVAYGIPAEVTSFAEGEISSPSPKYVGGKSTQGLATFMGPCPPAGLNYAHYVFVVVATDLDPKALPPGLTRDELIAKLDGHAKAAASLVGLFRHP